MTVRTQLARWLLGPELSQLQALLEAAPTLNTMLSEPGWNPLGEGGSLREWPDLSRKALLNNSRYYYAHDPLIGQAARLYRDYTIGQGISWTARDPVVQKAIEDFSRDPRNQNSFVSYNAQAKMMDRLSAEGELFIAFHTNTQNGRVAVRFVPPEEITAIVTADGDADWPLYYRREWTERKWSFDSHVWATENKSGYYRAMNSADATHDTMSREGTDVCLYHVAINTLGQRGVPAYSRAIPWVKAFKGFMEDRATLTLAQATFAFRLTVEGSKAAVDRAKELWDAEGGDTLLDRYVTGAQGGLERAPGGRTWIANKAANLEQFKVDSGASNAYQDGRMLKHQFCAATGIFEHYTGDPSTGNLATATAMELPMLKMFESWQQLVGDVYGTVLHFVIQENIRAGNVPGTVARIEEAGIQYWQVEPGERIDEESGESVPINTFVDVDFPPIVQREVATFVGAVVSGLSSGALGQSLKDPRYREAVRLLLQALGINNVENVLAATDMAIAAGDVTEQPPALPLVQALRQALARPGDLAGRLQELHAALEEAIDGNGAH